MIILFLVLVLSIAFWLVIYYKLKNKKRLEKLKIISDTLRGATINLKDIENGEDRRKYRREFMGEVETAFDLYEEIMKTPDIHSKKLAKVYMDTVNNFINNGN